MMRWELLILETVQTGGSLVFLKDQAPAHFEEWLRPLTSVFNGEIPFVKRQVQDLLQEKFQTKPQDLVVFFEEQAPFIGPLNSILQGQRIYISGAENKTAFLPVDYIWPSCSLEEWNHIFQKLQMEWGKITKIDDFKDSHQKPCLFLDRDDVVVKNVPYNKDPAKVELLPGIAALISQAHARGYWVSLVTNQSGLGRGRITWAEYQNVHQRMLKLLAERNCWIDECVWAGFMDQDDIPQGRLYAGLRKPRVGMFQMVHAKLKVNMPNSMMVGDSSSDLIAAFGAGVGSLYLLSSDKTDLQIQELLEFKKENPNFKFTQIQSFSEIKLD